MNLESENIAKVVSEEDGKKEDTRKHLKMRSVAVHLQKDVDWNRNAHSSPVKGYRRFSDHEAVQETTDNYQVETTLIYYT